MDNEAKNNVAQKYAARWQKFLSGLSPRVAAAVNTDAPIAAPVAAADTESGFAAFRSGLTPVAAAVCTAQIPTPPRVWPADRKPCWCLIEQEEGEAVVIKQFSTARDMVDRLQQLEGRDVFVVPVYGIILPYSESPDRLLIMPDNTAIRLRDARRLRNTDNVLTMQQDFFLGAAELTIPPDTAPRAAQPKSKKAPPQEKSGGETAGNPVG